MRTKLLASSELENFLSVETINRALARPRHTYALSTLSLLPLVFRVDDISGIRWDPVFLIPVNQAAKTVAEFMAAEAWCRSESVSLAERGDTLIVDNWRVLHGRESIIESAVDRELERIYLSEIYE